MFPGLTTKISEETGALSTITTVKRDLFHVTSTTATTVVTTIQDQFGGGFSGMFILLNRSGNNITTLTTGNIATAVTIGQNVSILFTYSKLTNKWYPGALA